MSVPAATEAAAPPSRRLWWILGWCVLALFTGIAAYALPWADVIAALAGAKWHWALLAVFVSLAGWPFWILQWQLLAPKAHRPSFARMAQVTALSGAANTSLPMTGVVASVGFLIVRGRLPASAAASLYTVDQLVTGIGKVATLSLAALLVPVPDWIRSGLLALAGVMALVTVALLVAAHGGNRLRRLGIGLSPRPARLLGHVADFVDHLEPLRNPVLGSAVVLLTFAKTAAEVLMVMTVQVAVGIEPSVAAAVLVVAALDLATMAPVSPGHLGVFEATVILCYQYLGVPLPLATAAALIHHGVLFVASLVSLGYLGWALPQDDKGQRRLDAP
jgi:uncharacterized membrane protein YbhN (UPF0104 family)